MVSQVSEEISISVNGGDPVTMSREAFDRLGDNGQPIRTGVPMRGKLLKTIINKVCQGCKKTEDEWPLNSVAVGSDCIVATDTHSAIIVGDLSKAGAIDSTSRKSAMLESEREKIYEDFVDTNFIERLTDPSTGEVVPYGHDVAKVVKDSFAKFDQTISMNPHLLLAATQAAIDAGAFSIDLRFSEDDDRLLGFEFEYIPEDQLDLFGENKWHSVPVVGVIAARIKKEQPE